MAQGLRGWVDEFERSYSVPSLELAQFLRDYVPSGTPYQAPTAAGAFDGVRDLQENQMYGLLLAGLDQITAPIPEDRRPRCFNTSNTTPKLLDSSQHPMRPNIAVTHPGVDAPENNCDWEWSMCACTIEIQEKKSSDPITAEGRCKIVKAYRETIRQLAQSGRNLLHGNLSCFVFVVGIYGNTARIFRFDRSGVIISKAFEYVSSPHILAEFFWRLVHPTNKTPGYATNSQTGRLVGSDLTVSRPTETEAKLMAGRIRRYHPKLDITSDDIQRHSLWVGAEWTEPPATNNSPPDGCPVRCLTIGKPLWQSMGLFSRATVVWRVVFEHYEQELCALKDSWRERCQLPEWYFYDRISTYAREQNWDYEGIATLVGSVDLAERYPDSGHRTRSAEIRLTPSPHELSARPLDPTQSSQQSTSEQFFQSGTTLREGSSGQLGHLFLTTHTAFTESVLLAPATADSSPHDRNHMRTVTWPVGESVSNYASTRQLANAVRSAIKGHKLAYACGVLHRDISPGNVLLSNKGTLSGFIHDFDCSLAIPRPGEHVAEQTVQAIKSKLKDMTGTYQFMAIDVLNHRPHEARHDLESFYWLTILCLLRRGDHDRGILGYHDLVDQEGEKTAAGRKIAWLSRESELDITRNTPLSQLLKELASLFRRQIHTTDRADKAATYEAVLQIFDAALARVWPDDDQFNPRQDPTVTENSQVGRGQKRKADSQVVSGRNQKKARCRKGAPSGGIA